MVVLDAMEKAAGVRVLQTELNDRPGVCLKLVGSLGDVQAFFAPQWPVAGPAPAPAPAAAAASAQPGQAMPATDDFPTSLF